MPILFLTTSDHMLELARGVLKEDFPEIRFFQVPWVTDFAASGISDMLESEGVEVVIARGAIARRVRALGLPISVVDIPVLAVDLIEALARAGKHGKKVAAVASREMLTGIKDVGKGLGLDVRLYSLASHVSPESLVAKAIEDGADALVGSYVTSRIASDAGVHAEVICTSPEVIRQTADEARRIILNLGRERARGVLFKTLLDHTAEGVVAVDKNGGIIAWNPEAERITGRAYEDIQDSLIAEACPDLALEETFLLGKDEQGAVLSIGGVDVVCNKRLVTMEGEPVAVFASFQEISRIQQIEAKVRRKIYASGHAATRTFGDIKGNHPLMRRAVSMAKEFAITDSSVMLLGETGVGKEMFAQSIHNFSRRAQGPFVAINCAALPSNLLESELFGYEPGAFTGANPKGKPGLFELAHGGTLLLDEVGEMDLMIQGKMLRVLEERKVMRLGSERLIPVDVRIVASTNRNLQTLIAEQRFRQDLYYRFNVLRLTIPPLRERPEDLEILAVDFLRKHTAALKRRTRLTTEAVAELKRHNWPGNVRELYNFMERVAVVNKSAAIAPEEIRQLLAEEQMEPLGHSPEACIPQDPAGSPKGTWETGKAGETDMDTIKRALECTNGNASKAARMLGISRITLWRKLKQYEV